MCIGCISSAALDSERGAYVPIQFRDVLSLKSTGCNDVFACCSECVRAPRIFRVGMPRVRMQSTLQAKSNAYTDSSKDNSKNAGLLHNRLASCTLSFIWGQYICHVRLSARPVESAPGWFAGWGGASGRSSIGANSQLLRVLQ